MKKFLTIFINAVPILIMMAFIPLIQNDYVLALVHVIIIALSLLIKQMKNDLPVLVFGFFAMIICEYIFVSTGVETFIRNSLFGLMPLWLPFLWAYSFVAIKRSVRVLEE